MLQLKFTIIYAGKKIIKIKKKIKKKENAANY